jgi:hypothetical protein
MIDSDTFYFSSGISITSNSSSSSVW